MECLLKCKYPLKIMFEVIKSVGLINNNALLLINQLKPLAHCIINIISLFNYSILIVNFTHSCFLLPYVKTFMKFKHAIVQGSFTFFGRINILYSK